MDDPLWQGGAVWQLVFGQADEDGALDVLDHICRTAVGSGVDAKLFGGTSVGVVFGLRLVDGRRIVVKAHQPRERAAFLLAAHDAQLKLHKSGFPCPLPLSTPMAFGDAHATFEELVDEGTLKDSRSPGVRRTMAETLAWHLELTKRCGVHAGFDGGWRVWDAATVWPAEAHSPIFDFAATAEGAEWIDEIARAARRRFAAGEHQVGHSDWSAKHFRFVDGVVRIVYDWDSLSLQSEEQLVGTAAGTFTANPLLHDGVYVPPLPEEVRLFIDEYSTARASPLSSTQRLSIHAAATYIIAYSARCEHALAQYGRFSEALREFGSSYLEPES